jgi:hypothetical protein
MAFLYGRVGCLPAQNGGFRPGQNHQVLAICFVAGGATSAGEKDAVPAQKLGQLQPFIAVRPQECMGQLGSFGPT